MNNDKKSLNDDDKKKLVNEIIGYTYEFNYVTDQILQMGENFSKYNLTAKQLRIIKILNQKDLTINELAQKIESTPSSLSQILSKMEKQNFIKRLINVDDRREIFVSLGKKGLEYMNEVSDLYKKTANLYINDMSDEELEQIRVFYIKIIDLVKQYLK